MTLRGTSTLEANQREMWVMPMSYSRLFRRCCLGSGVPPSKGPVVSVLRVVLVSVLVDSSCTPVEVDGISSCISVGVDDGSNCIPAEVGDDSRKTRKYR